MKRKREPLTSPTTPSSKKKNTEVQDHIEECPLPNSSRQKIIPSMELIPTPPLSVQEKKSDEGVIMVEAKFPSSNILSLLSPLPRFKEKYTEVNEFSLLMKNALLDHPYESGSDIASRTINHYRQPPEVGQVLHFLFYF